MNREIFESGIYHSLFDARLSEIPFRANLTNDYAVSLQLACEQGFQSPLDKVAPKALLCGSAGYPTASTFVDFVHANNPETDITILDLSKQPLQEIHDRKLDKKAKVALVNGDAKFLPFQSASFDFIDTDALLQFLPQEERKQVIDEWFRVLKPGGVVTTREWLLTNSEEERNMHRSRNIQMHANYGVRVYPITKEEFSDSMKNSGFSLSMKSMNELHPNRSLYLQNYSYLHYVVGRKPRKLK